VPLLRVENAGDCQRRVDNAGGCRNGVDVKVAIVDFAGWSTRRILHHVILIWLLASQDMVGIVNVSPGIRNS